MSIYSSISCPKCKQEELSIATAFSWNKLRFSCNCGYEGTLELTNEESNYLSEVLIKGRIKEVKE